MRRYKGEGEMRTVALGVMVLAMGLTGVSAASATPIKAAAIDEAAVAVSLMTKTRTASSAQFRGHAQGHHHHHHTAATTPIGGRGRAPGGTGGTSGTR